MNEIIEIECEEVKTPLQILSESSLVIRAEAKLTVNDFGDDFKSRADIALKSLANLLNTDEDFARAERDIKACKETEDKMKQALDDLTKGNVEIARAKETIDKYISLFSSRRLDLNRSVTERDKAKKKKIVDDGIKKVADLVSASPVAKHFQPNNQKITDSIKRKSKYSVMEECVAAVVEEEKKRLEDIEAIYLANTTAIDKARIDYPVLFHDRDTLALKPVENVVLVIESRVAAQKLADKERKEKEAAAEKERIEREDAEKKENLARETLAAEAAERIKEKQVDTAPADTKPDQESLAAVPEVHFPPAENEQYITPKFPDAPKFVAPPPPDFLEELPIQERTYYLKVTVKTADPIEMIVRQFLELECVFDVTER